MAAAQQAMVALHDPLRHLAEEAAAVPERAVLLALATLFFVVLLPLKFRHFTASIASPKDDELLNRLPSPPNKLPIIGHLHLMGAFPPISLAALAAKHGPDFMLLRLGTMPTVIVSSTRAAEAILRTHDHIFASRPTSMIAEVVIYGQSDSCYSPYGDHFRKVRKVLTVHLLNSNKVQAYRPTREEEVGLVMAKLKLAATASSVVDMSELLNSFANDLICRAVSGKFSRAEGRNKLFRDLIDANVRLLGGFNLEDYFPRLARVGPLRKILCANAKKMSQRWDKLLEEVIGEHEAKAARRQEDEAAEAEQEDSDFVDVLLSRQHEYGLTRDHIKALLMDMFEAGTDTSYSTLDAAMAELMRKPQVMAKLQDEVRRNVPQGQEMVTESDLANMTYLKAVIKETLRLHPAAPLFIPHLSMETCDIDGYTIPSGTRVMVNAWAIARLSSHWDNPDEFVPERFVEANDVDLKGKDFRYLPFGYGRRMCPGIHSAAVTLEIMLANLMYCFDWELPAGVKKEDIDMTEVFGLSVHRKEKLLLVPKIP